MNQRKTFTSQFQREAVRLMESWDKPATDGARQLGVRAQHPKKRPTTQKVNKACLTLATDWWSARLNRMSQHEAHS